MKQTYTHTWFSAWAHGFGVKGDLWLCFGAFRDACLLFLVHITSLMESNGMDGSIRLGYCIHAYIHTYRYDCDIRGWIYLGWLVGWGVKMVKNESLVGGGTHTRTRLRVRGALDWTALERVGWIGMEWSFLFCVFCVLCVGWVSGGLRWGRYMKERRGRGKGNMREEGGWDVLLWC